MLLFPSLDQIPNAEPFIPLIQSPHIKKSYDSLRHYQCPLRTNNYLLADPDS